MAEKLTFDDLTRIMESVAKDMPDATKKERESEFRIRVMMSSRDIEKNRGKNWNESVPARVPGPPKKVSRNRVKSETEKEFAARFKNLPDRVLMIVDTVTDDPDVIRAANHGLYIRRTRKKWESQNRVPAWRRYFFKKQFRITNPTANNANVRDFTAEKETNRAFFRVTPAKVIFSFSRMTFSVRRDENGIMRVF